MTEKKDKQFSIYLPPELKEEMLEEAGLMGLKSIGIYLKALHNLNRAKRQNGKSNYEKAVEKLETYTPEELNGVRQN